MIVGCYKTNGEVLVLPLPELAARVKLPESTIKRAMDGKASIPGMVFVKLSSDSTLRGR